MHQTALLILFSTVAALAAETAAPMVVSSASRSVAITPDSLATVYGTQLATVTASASAPPWPTMLGDISVLYVTDAAGRQHMAQLLYVSPTQINFWVPAETAPGGATVQFPFTGLPPGVGAAALRNIPVEIKKVAPGLFSVDGAVAAATAVRVVIPTQIQSPVSVFTCDAAKCTATAIDTGVDAPVYLSLFGTGLRAASSLTNISVTIGGMKVTPIYAGPQNTIPGLDQVNVLLPISLRGSGLVDVTVTADGVTSNPVKIRIQ